MFIREAKTMKKLVLGLFLFLLLLIVACSQNQTVSNPLLKDRDALIEVVKPLDNYIGVEDSKSNTNYKESLLAFVEEELNKSVSSFETIHSQNDSRSMVVITQDGHIYKVLLNNQSGKWGVNGYSEVNISE